MKKILVGLIFPYVLSAQDAFISGNETICSNGNMAEVKVSFNGSSPYNFVYAIDGVPESPITTSINPYIINTYTAGVYTLISFSDADPTVIFDSISGSSLVTVLESPTAIIHLPSDTLSIINSVANFASQSIGDIVGWIWNFGDNTADEFSSAISHSYDSLGIYQTSLIVVDNNGCVDTASHTVWVRDEFWLYIPNSFTPDEDMVNDKFCIEYSGIREATFLFKIFNSQGNLMFQSENPLNLKCSIGAGWDGKDLDQVDLFLDTYTYEMYFKDFEGWEHYKYGTVTLVR